MPSDSTKISKHTRKPYLLSALASIAMLVGVAGADGVTLGSSDQLLSYHRVGSATPAAGPYLAQVKHLSGEIAAKIGHPLSLTLSVVLNPTEIKIDGKPAAAYADALNHNGGQTGTASRCVVHLNPSLYNQQDTGLFNFVLAHEVFHCFEAMDYPTLQAFGTAPDWLIEGEAEWVGDTIVPTEDGYWDTYLTAIDVSLFTRRYSAIGFYALMTESGQDTWHLLDPMLKAPSSAAAYAVAANNTLRMNWASSLAREPGFGRAWDATGPGITNSKYRPNVSVVHDGTVLKDNVQPYTNALIRFSPATDVVDITASTPYSRLHEADGTEIDNLTSGTQYCVHECEKCPEMKQMPKLAAGTTWLAVTGDVAGASFNVTGAPAMCSCILGTWTVTSTTGPSTSGGAGVVWTVSSKKTIVVDYNNSAALIGVGGFSYVYRGIANYLTTLPADPTGSSGSYEATPTAQSVTATYTVPGKGPITTPVTETAHATTWTCDGNSLTLSVAVAGGSFVYALTRSGF